MICIQAFTFNPFQENTFILYDDHSKHAIIVDPGMNNKQEEEELQNFIDSNNLLLQSILNTHAHIDHILGVNYILSNIQIPFILHPNEQIIFDNAEKTALQFGLNFNKPKVVPQYADINEYHLGDEKFIIKLVPGHSPGSVVIYYEKGGWAIVGDTLFNGSIGRTDLIMGDYDTLITGIKRELLTLPLPTIIYPGHGPESSIEKESTTNPFLNH